jgi:hypothetical protein
MKIEKSLNLVSATKPTSVDPITKRRSTLLRAINRQVQQLRKHQNGEKTSRPWFWRGDDGKIYLQIKYGKTPIELSKGKFAIECSSIENIETNLDIVEALVCTGDFDDHLAEVSKNIRSNFKKV